jgi:hypothetical protein
MASSALKTLAGTDIVIVRNWHITIFTFLFSFIVLFIFFDVFQPASLASSAGDFIVPQGDGVGPFQVGTSESDKAKSNKLLSDRGRIIFFAYSIGIGAGIAILIHFLLVYYR